MALYPCPTCSENFISVLLRDRHVKFATQDNTVVARCWVQGGRRVSTRSLVGAALRPPVTLDIDAQPSTSGGEGDVGGSSLDSEQLDEAVWRFSTCANGNKGLANSDLTRLLKLLELQAKVNHLFLSDAMLICHALIV